ncbi:hypothetical protein PAXRUDRAFT_36512 [Paxillus rubicundulus Ve08.2h10]|uniref:Uncharacterized protein n=1 Tax=Paxillus rubicundulus Ve08.2h10 TaxID=930991 RepID=A0A0D0CUG7_9AGAM|nr:hypothetical protein PAXRUDRAFT_36512 [Paxillus rubicundulus Ve08.2h10]
MSVSHKALIICISGQIIHPLNLCIEFTSHLPPTLQPIHSTETWVVSVIKLSAVVDALWELMELNQANSHVPKCGGDSEGFPYKLQDGSLAFVAETATKQLLTKRSGNADKTIECPVCEKTVKHKALHSYMRGHILQVQMGVSEDDINIPVSMVDPCGFCGQSGHLVWLVKEGQKWTFQPSSSCPFSIIFSIGAYNMAHHISTVHSGLNPNQPLPLVLATAMKITHSEQQALGIPPDLISGDDKPQTPASRKRKHAATHSSRYQSCT